MSQLYTSLTRLKMAMNHGELPPMMSLPAQAQDVLDPAFTIGLGALTEDAERGLRCPVRNCGVYRHVLGRHLQTRHPAIGSDGLRSLLDLPHNVRLVSTKYREAKSAEAARRGDALLAQLAEARRSRSEGLNDGETNRRRVVGQKMVFRSIGARNLRNACEEQVRHRFLDLHEKLGRSPSRKEADLLEGTGFSGQVIDLYGSWNAAKAQFGIEQYRRGHRREISRVAVLEALAAYHRANGCLPNVNQAQRPTRTPLIPSRPTILKAMETNEWPEAMRRAAALLNIRGGRYGLPVQGAA